MILCLVWCFSAKSVLTVIHGFPSLYSSWKGAMKPKKALVAIEEHIVKSGGRVPRLLPVKLSHPYHCQEQVLQWPGRYEQAVQGNWKSYLKVKIYLSPGTTNPQKCQLCFNRFAQSA